MLASTGCTAVATTCVDPNVDTQQFRRTPKLPSNATGFAKVLTSWNGLMLAAFAEAARALDRDDGSRALAASYRLVHT
jgi:uncharacterized protein YyaL (SSP411 family)